MISNIKVCILHFRTTADILKFVSRGHDHDSQTHTEPDHMKTNETKLVREDLCFSPLDPRPEEAVFRFPSVGRAALPQVLLAVSVNLLRFASVAGRVGELAAVCQERVVVGAAGRRSSAGEAASCQVMNPGLSSVVSSTLVEGAPGATNLTRPALVPSPLHFHTPAHEALLQARLLSVTLSAVIL